MSNADISEEAYYFESVIHEMRNHLNIINLSSETLLARRVVSDDDQEILKSMILKNGQVLSQLINDVLDLSKIKNKIFHHNPENVSLETLLSELEYEYRFKAQEKKIDFLSQREGELPLNIKTDPVRVLQILRNLLNNAFKYTRRGSIELNVSQRISAQRNELVFDIKDTGSGIPKDDQDKIFKKFVRSKVHNKIEGVGIGLALSKELANILDGDIELIDSSENGSHFRVSLNIELASETDFNEYEESKICSDWSDKRILIADDIQENRQLYQIFLKETRAHIEFAQNGVEAVSLATSKDFDLALLDIEMPIMDGREAIKKIKQIKPTLPVIAVTGLSAGKETFKLKQIGFNDVVLKPIDVKSFNKKLEEHF